MKLIEALNINGQNPPRNAGETLSIALVCGFTPLHLQTFLMAELRGAFPARHVEITTGEYDNIAGKLADLGDRRYDAVVLVLEWPDIDPRLGTRQLGGWSPRSLSDIVDRAEVFLEGLEDLVAASASPVVASLPTLPLPPLFHTAGWQAGTHELQLRELLYRFAGALSRNPRIRFIREQTSQSQRLDVRSNWAAGFPYQIAHASALAELLSKSVQNAQPKKGIITDLDNTLWSGIVGEDGASSVAWDLDHRAQGHGVYQQFLSTLAPEGVLVAVDRQNEPDVVAGAFARKDILLARDHVFPFEVNWGSKAESISRVLGAWSVDADSVIFVDDDPLELASVKAAHPSMECLKFPARDPEGIYALIVSLRDTFGRNAISHEDEIRRESLRARSLAAASNNAGEAFSEILLEDAGGELTFDFAKDANDPRPLELINKTNQFNLNGKRFTEGKWADYLSQGDTFLLTSAYRDKFGALGKIAVVAGRVESEQQVYVDTWVLSCRAFGRRIEHHCLNALFEKFGARNIRFAYESTERNKPITRCLTDLLETAPKSGAVLSASAFQVRCPKLLHRINMDGADNG